MPDTLSPWQALPVRSPDLEAYYAEVRSLQHERAGRARRSAKIAWGIAAASLVSTAALAISVASLLPAQRLVPLPIVLESDGTWDTAANISRLPPNMREAAVRAAIWQYVKAREGYSFASARYDYNLVSRMSSPLVGKAYQDWFLPRNKQSPQVTVGKKGQVDVHEISITFIRPQVALVRFWRSIEMYGGRPEKATWSATVEVAGREQMTAHDRLLDPSGIIVSRYSSSEDSASP